MKKLLLISIGVVLILSSCSSSKDLQKTSTNAKEDVLKEVSDSLRVYKSEKLRLEALIRQMEFLAGEFDVTKCPQIVFPKGAAMMDKDSVQKLVNELNQAIDDMASGANNTIKKYADGTIELKGRIKNFKSINEKQSQTITEVTKERDSLRMAKQKERIIKETVTITKTKHKKTSFLNQWWLFPAGMIFWALLGGRIKRFFKSINLFTKKTNTMNSLTFLSIFEFGWGGLLTLTLVLLGGATLLFLYAKRVSNSGTSQQTGKGTVYTNEKTPIWKISFFKGGVVLVILWIIIMFMIASDYKHAKPYTPTIQTDTTRQAAEDIGK